MPFRARAGPWAERWLGAPPGRTLADCRSPSTLFLSQGPGKSKNGWGKRSHENRLMKSFQIEVHYRPGSSDLNCNQCAMFIAPNGCLSVKGLVSMGAFCDLFERKDPPWAHSETKDMKRL